MQTPRISARALIVEGNSILAAEYKDKEGTWYTLPGGGQQRGEDLIACVQRELLEETGLKVTVGNVRYINEFITDNFHGVAIIFECKIKHNPDLSLATNLDPGQVGWKWLQLERLEKERFYPPKIARLLTSNNDSTIYLGQE
jgi:8-oxo-dGTP diphosphatase